MRHSVDAARWGGLLKSHWSQFSEPLKQDLQAAGLLDAERQRLRRNAAMLATIALVAAAAGVIGISFMAERSSDWLLFVSLSLGCVSCAAFVKAAAFSPLSEAGARVAERWEGFYLYLCDVAHGRQPPLRSGRFEKYLPYAVSFGLAEAWTTSFEKQGVAGIPAWLEPLTEI